MTEFTQFISKPVRQVKTSSNTKERWARIALFLAIGLFLDIVHLLSIGLVLDNWASLEYKFDILKVGYVLAALIFAPISEELIFRAGLRGARYSLFVGPVLIAMLVGSTQIVAYFASIVMLIAIAWKYLLPLIHGGKKPGSQFLFGRRFIQLYPWVFWLYAGAFAIAHVNNYRLNDASGLLVIFAVIPQFVLGILLGYLRLRDGMRSALLLHFLNNLFAVSFVAAFG